MNFYNNMHPYYCEIDLHARTLYICTIDQDENIVVGVEYMHCWYWVADFCENIGADFIQSEERLN